METLGSVQYIYELALRTCFQGMRRESWTQILSLNPQGVTPTASSHPAEIQPQTLSQIP